MKIVLLGTDVPTPSVARAGSSYLVEMNDSVLLFDSGPGAHMRLLQSGRKPTAIRHVFLTHWHYDHTIDLPHIVLQHWDQGAGRVPELEIADPPPTRRIVRQLFGDDGVYGPDLAARTNCEMSVDTYEARGGVRPRKRPNPHVTETGPGVVIEGRGWRLHAIEVPHAQPYLTCLAYRLESAEGTLVYSGDAGPTPAMEEFARGADVLIHMSHFMTGTETNEDRIKNCGNHRYCADVARRAGVGTLVLTHLGASFDAPSVAERVAADVSAAYSGRIVVARDLVEFDVNTAARGGA